MATSPTSFAVGYVVLALLCQGVFGLESKNIALIVGCTIGGVIFLILVLILVILVCKRPASGAKSRGGPDYYPSRSNGRSTVHSADAAPVPPGIWTTNPSMYATRPPPAHPQYANGYANRHDPIDHHSYQVPWYQRTVRFARNVIKRIPAVFQVEKPYKPVGGPILNPRLSKGDGREKTMRLDNDMESSAGGRLVTSTGSTARAFSAQPAGGGGGGDMPRFVAKVYSDYQLPHDTVLSTPETARAYSGERVVSPEYSVPHDAFRFTQSDAALDRRDDAGGGAVSRARSSVEPRVPDGAGRYGHGVHMQRSDAQDYAGRRRAGGNGGGGGGRFGVRPMEPMPVPSQLLMYRHMQEEHARQKAADRAAAVLAGGRGGGEAAEAVRHYAPDDNPNALYAQPSKVKRQSGGGGAAEPGRMVTVEAVIEDREPADGHRPRSRAKDDVDGRHPGEVTDDAFKFLEDFEDNVSLEE